MDAKKLKIENSMKLFERAKKLIPCQTQTLSKGYTQFVLGACPIFLKSGKGSHVFDVDGNEYIDFPLALGPVTLGYQYPAVDDAVKEQMKEGITFSMPHPLEVELAELLVKTIPCAEMVRYGKNGSDVTSMAVKLARAYTGKEKIAYCGYHGWEDWYVITTERNKGVPKFMKNFMLKFEYNNIESLERIFKENKDIAAVIMEPVGIIPPEDDFLEKVKELSNKNGAVLIFDEMVTGFRMALGGAQEYFKVTPDLAAFGKGMANGMPLSAVVGKKEIMNEAENVFFSMTFGGETLSLAAGMATIREMKEKKATEHMWKQGGKIKKGFDGLAEKYGINAKCAGYGVHNVFQFKTSEGKDDYNMKSLFIQEVVKRGVLFSCTQNFCLSHSDADIEKGIKSIEEAFKVMKKAADENKVREMIEGEPVRPVFREP